MTELKYLNKYLLKYKTNLLLGFFIIIIARILLLFTPGLIRESVNVIDEFRKGNIISIETVQTELIQNIFLILLAAIAAGIFTFLTRQTIIKKPSKRFFLYLKRYLFKYFNSPKLVNVLDN